MTYYAHFRAGWNIILAQFWAQIRDLHPKIGERGLKDHLTLHFEWFIKFTIAYLGSFSKIRFFASKTEVIVFKIYFVPVFSLKIIFHIIILTLNCLFSLVEAIHTCALAKKSQKMPKNGIFGSLNDGTRVKYWS